MSKLRQFLWILAAVAVSIIMMHILFIRKYNMREAAIHIVQSLQIDVNKDKHGELAIIDPHGNNPEQHQNVEDILPEVVTKPPQPVEKTRTGNKDEAKKPAEKPAEISVKTETKQPDAVKKVIENEKPKDEKGKSDGKNGQQGLCEKGKNLGKFCFFVGFKN